MLPNKRNAKLLWITAALVLAVFVLWAGFQPFADDKAFPQGTLDILHADGSKAAFKVEIATTPQQQELGLMYRKHLDANRGMIFVWPDEQIINMWMKNTEIPLDMLFVTRDGKISKIIANAVPYDLTTLSSDAPVKAVIEIGGGEAEHQHIKTGDRIVYPGFPPVP